MTASSFYSWFGYYCFIFNISLNLVLSIIRIFQGHVKINIKIEPVEESGNILNDSNDSNDSIISCKSQRSYSIKNKGGKEILGVDNQDVIVEVFNKAIQYSDFGANPSIVNYNNREGSYFNLKESLLGMKTSKTVVSINSAPLKKKSKFYFK